MLVTLLVLWVVVVPVVTLAGMYVLSGVRGRRLRVRGEYSRLLAAEPARTAPSRRHRGPIRMRNHARRSRDHAVVER